MNSLVYELYFHIKRYQKRRSEKGRNDSRAIRFILGYIEWFYNIFIAKLYRKIPSKRSGITKRQRDEKVIISLTSYPKRIGTIWLTIETLLRQTVKPDEIVLWLAESQFEGEESLPLELIQMKKRGLTIRFCDDLRSHKKYYYAMKENPDAIVILADDDMFYPYNMVEKLLKMHKKYPQDICTMTAQVIVPDENPSAWRNPYTHEFYEHTQKIQVYSGSGSLFPPHSLHKDVFDKEKIKVLCPYADDLWVTYMAFRQGTKITMQNPWHAFPVTIYGTGEGSLYYINGEGKENDRQWEKLCNKYETRE